MRLRTELKEGIVIAASTLRANKMRSALTTLGVVIGIVTVTLMQTAISGLDKAFLNSISAIGTDILYVDQQAWFSDEPWWKRRNRRPILMQHARALAQQTKLAKATCPQAGDFGTIKYRNRSASSVMILGCGDEMAEVSNLVLTQGRFLSPGEVMGSRPVCVLGADLAANFFSNESALGKKISIKGYSYEVVGVIGKIGSLLGVLNFDNRVIIPITRFQEDIAHWPNVTIAVKVANVQQLEECTDELRGIMRKLRRLEPGMPDDFAINQQEAFINTFKKLSLSIAATGLIISSLSLLVGGIGIMNIMFVSVAERTQEIGLRKALGARRRTILIQFLIEAAGICLFGGIIALFISWPLCQVIARFLPASMSLSTVCVALIISLATGVVSGFLPAYRASRMSPVEALRNE